LVRQESKRNVRSRTKPFKERFWRVQRAAELGLRVQTVDAVQDQRPALTVKLRAITLCQLRGQREVAGPQFKYGGYVCVKKQIERVYVITDESGDGFTRE
jgi:hypothetical protein